jgi:hypothetical protein
MCECDAPVSVGSASGVSRETRLDLPNCSAILSSVASIPPGSAFAAVEWGNGQAHRDPSHGLHVHGIPSPQA